MRRKLARPAQRTHHSMRPKLSPVLLPFAFDFEHLTVFDFECCGSLVAAVRVTDVTRTVHVLHSLCMPWEVPIGSVFSEPAQVCNILIYFSDPMDPRNVEAQRCQNHLKHSKSPQRSWQHDAPCVLCYEHHCPGLKNVAAEASCNLCRVASLETAGERKSFR